MLLEHAHVLVPPPAFALPDGAHEAGRKHELVLDVNAPVRRLCIACIACPSPVRPQRRTAGPASGVGECLETRIRTRMAEWQSAPRLPRRLATRVVAVWCHPRRRCFWPRPAFFPSLSHISIAFAYVLAKVKTRAFKR